MCGILGIFGKEKLDNFKLSLGAIKHRGPDDDGIYYDSLNNIMLGHNRLSIQDVSSSGHQPMFNNNLVIVFNGEIYNWKSLTSSGDSFSEKQNVLNN